jgi:sterol desaturase/sphingolipid hydroxylase (fatty acid hydroxylase superfamily)
MFAVVQNWIFESLVQPLMFALGLMGLSEIAFDSIEWFMVGVIEVTCLGVFLTALERRFPFSATVTSGLTAAEQRSTRRIDIAYTLLHRLGVFPLVAFALLTAPFNFLETQLRLVGWSGVNIDQVMPGVSDVAIVSFVFYLIVLDGLDYWIHRAQHRFQWMWALHAVHHSQRYMTFWSDQRNHLLEDLIRDALLAAAALLIGVAPEQFIGLVVLSRVVESIQHANWNIQSTVQRLPGRAVLLPLVNQMQHWVVGPRFHRVHHGIGIGHEGSSRGVNFGVLFSFWDRIFGTADFLSVAQPTGIRDQLFGKNYGRGFFAQQWLGLCRMVGRG